MTEPSEKEVEAVARAICCPFGCKNSGIRDDIAGRVAICQAGSFRGEAISAIAAYEKAKAEEARKQLQHVRRLCRLDD